MKVKATETCLFSNCDPTKIKENICTTNQPGTVGEWCQRMIALWCAISLSFTINCSSAFGDWKISSKSKEWFASTCEPFSHLESWCDRRFPILVSLRSLLLQSHGKGIVRTKALMSRCDLCLSETDCKWFVWYMVDLLVNCWELCNPCLVRTLIAINFRKITGVGLIVLR